MGFTLEEIEKLQQATASRADQKVVELVSQLRQCDGDTLAKIAEFLQEEAKLKNETTTMKPIELTIRAWKLILELLELSDPIKLSPEHFQAVEVLKENFEK